MFIAAPSSGQGKTTVTSALARFFARQGKDVRVFKTGPDYLDPQILAQASGKHVEQLDMWMAGEAYCQQKFYEAACEADLILVAAKCKRCSFRAHGERVDSKISGSRTRVTIAGQAAARANLKEAMTCTIEYIPCGNNEARLIDCGD